MISAQPHKAVQERLIEQLMKLPNDAVSPLISRPTFAELFPLT
jgi:hypothetical protein